MLKPRYYYSDGFFIGTASVVVDDHGDLIDWTNVRNKKPVPRVTICGIWDTEKNTMAYGAALCSPEDQFVKKTGRELAYIRALEKPITTVYIKDESVSETFINYASSIEAQILDHPHSFKF